MSAAPDLVPTQDRFTPGPWFVVYEGRQPEIVDTDHYTLAEVWGEYDDRHHADAHLIAAAPVLLTALRDAVSKCPDCEGATGRGDHETDQWYPCPTCREWRAAIKQAEGDT